MATREKSDAGRLSHARNSQVVFYIISFLSLSVLAALTITTQQRSLENQKTLISAAFGTICLLGITAGISPSHCNRLVGHTPVKRAVPSEQKNGASEKKTSQSFKGHHPACGNFSSHIIHIGDRTYCAGCTGLVIGATIALVGTIFYNAFQSLSVQLVATAFWSGFTGVALGVLQYNLFTKRASIHLLLNVVFVVGSFLLLVGVTEMNGSFSVSVYSLFVILFLIYVRSSLSGLEHVKKCNTCNVEYCSIR